MKQSSPTAPLDLDAQAPAKSPLRVLIACGGTGGHLFPGVAVAQKLREQGHQPKLLISRKKVDSSAAEKYPELDFETVPTVARPPMASLGWPKFLLKLMQANKQAHQLIDSWKPQVVLGMGGFTALLPVRAAAQKGLVSAVHDSNAVPGKANRSLGKQVDLVMLGLEAAKSYFPEAKTCLTGTPVREELRVLPEVAQARAHFGLDAERRTVLVMGGSQGARAINETIGQDLPFYAKEGIQLIALTGRGSETALQEAAKQAGVRAAILDFCSEMPMAYAAADLVVARAGASSLSELAMVRKPSILVPFPHAADDHQSKNAQAFAERGAAMHLPQEQLGEGNLMRTVLAHLNEPAQLQAMAESLAGFAIEDAAGEIVNALEKLAVAKK